MEKEDIAKVFTSEQHLTWLATVLKLHGVSGILVEFSGSGDSGSVENVTAFSDNNERVDISSYSISWPESADHWDEESKSWDTAESVEVKSLEQVIKDCTYEALEVTGLDWYNNEGGQGSFSIDVTKTPPKLCLNVGINTISTDTHTFFEDYESEE